MNCEMFFINTQMDEIFLYIVYINYLSSLFSLKCGNFKNFFQAYLNLSYITPKTSVMSWRRKGVNYDRKVCVSSEYGYCKKKKKGLNLFNQ